MRRPRRARSLAHATRLMTFTAKAKVIMRPNHWSIAGSSNLLRSPIERLARMEHWAPIRWRVRTRNERLGTRLPPARKVREDGEKGIADGLLKKARREGGAA